MNPTAAELATDRDRCATRLDQDAATAEQAATNPALTAHEQAVATRTAQLHRDHAADYRHEAAAHRAGHGEW